MVVNIVISLGVGFAYSSLPALINAAVPVSETAAANRINALARSLGTSISSAVIGVVLATMTIAYGGHTMPSLNGLPSGAAHRRRRRRTGRRHRDDDPPHGRAGRSALSDWAAEEAELAGDPLIRG